MNTIKTSLEKVKATCPKLATIPFEVRNAILMALSEQLIKNSAQIIAANEKDLEKMDKSDPKYDRLKLDSARIQSIANELQVVANLPSPLDIILNEDTRPNGLLIQKVSVPIGVVAIIYESRPNVTIDVFSLCFKAGNACVLKGAKDAENTNQMLVAMIANTLKQFEIPKSCVFLMPCEREATNILLEAINLVDVCIPRGSQSLIDFVRQNAKIPVIETGAGIVHIYFDKAGDLQKGKNIIFNAKTRRVSVCNALDTLIIHQDRVSDLPELVSTLAQQQVQIYADKLSYNVLRSVYPQSHLHPATLADFGREFLSYKMAIKTVQCFEDAISHIEQYSSHHSEAIISEDKEACAQFMRLVDAAAVYANASTAFSDGGQFGMGSEIGISTQKLHARGPMGLEALTSYKWLVYGNGQIRTTEP